jgi:enoyl-CoA hydratase/carnithine racemase
MATAPTDAILVGSRGPTDVVTLNNESKYNALPLAALRELADYFDGLKRNTHTRVVLLRGAGSRAFCTGLELKEMGATMARLRAEGATAMYGLQLDWSNVMRAMRACPQPIIACACRATRWAEVAPSRWRPTCGWRRAMPRSMYR